MDLNGTLVHHGLMTMAGLGLTGVVPFGSFGRRELAVTKGKGRGEWTSPHRGQNRPAQRRGLAGGEEEEAATVVISYGWLWSTERRRKKAARGAVRCSGARGTFYRPAR
jgi:hypothetical protein